MMRHRVSSSGIFPREYSVAHQASIKDKLSEVYARLRDGDAALVRWLHNRLPSSIQGAFNE